MELSLVMGVLNVKVNGLSQAMSRFSIFCGPIFYMLFEGMWQKTPGKFLTHSVVIDVYGNKPELSTLVLRTLCRLVPFDAFSFLGETYSRGWHDRWSKTWVVSQEELAALRRLQQEQGLVGWWG